VYEVGQVLESTFCVSTQVHTRHMADDLEARVARFLPACRALPKVELHAHLNGCVRAHTLLDCAEKRATEVGRCQCLKPLHSLLNE